MFSNRFGLKMGIEIDNFGLSVSIDFFQFGLKNGGILMVGKIPYLCSAKQFRGYPREYITLTCIYAAFAISIICWLAGAAVGSLVVRTGGINMTVM